MSDDTAPAVPVRAVPEGYTTVTPWIIGADTAGLIDYLERAFGAEDLGRFVLEDGTIGHAELRIGNGRIMAFDSPPGWALAGTCSIHAVMLQAEKAMRESLAAQSLADVVTVVYRKAPPEFSTELQEWIDHRVNGRGRRSGVASTAS